MEEKTITMTREQALEQAREIVEKAKAIRLYLSDKDLYDDDPANPVYQIAEMIWLREGRDLVRILEADTKQKLEEAVKAAWAETTMLMNEMYQSEDGDVDVIEFTEGLDRL